MSCVKSHYGLSSFLAGIYIGLGCIFMTLVKSSIAMPTVLNSILSGLVFSIGLFLVFTANGSLFTGNCMLFIHVLDKTLKPKTFAHRMLITYVFNYFGIFVIAILASLAGLDRAVASNIAMSKFSKPPIELIFSGVLCNMLVCLAVVLNGKSNSLTDSFISALLPVTTFVACGFEHSVADMFFTFFAPEFISVLSVISSLLFITIGNFLGGIFIASIMYFMDILWTTKIIEK